IHISGYHSYIITPLYCREVLAWIHTPLNFINTYGTASIRHELELDYDVTILTTNTRLANEFAFDLGTYRANGFTICHLGLTDISVYLEFTPEAINENL